MPTYNIGQTTIKYDLERKDGIGRRYIQVMPHKVIVTVPVNDDEQNIEGFLRRKERWLFDNTQRMATLVATAHNIHRFVSGVKIPYRGRRVKLTIARKTTPETEVEYKNGFIVSLPDYVIDDVQDDIIESSLRLWLKKQIKKDIKEIVGRYSYISELRVKSIVVKEFKHMWGVCSKDGTITLNWQLIFAPKAVLEYAVLHELCHIKYRSHGKEFWAFVKKWMPDYEKRKNWLEKNEHMISIHRKIGTVALQSD